MPDGPLGALIRDFIDRVVNRHDLRAIDDALADLVSPQYRGTGSVWQQWAPDFDSLREFYRRQAVQRPDWRIDIQETMEVGEYVAVRALAGGRLALDEDGAPQAPPFPTSGEWLSTYRVVDGRIVEANVLTFLVTSHS